MKQALIQASILLLAVAACFCETTSVDPTFKGTVLAVSRDHQYQLPHPPPEDQPPILEFAQNPSLIPAWAYDVGQALVISSEGFKYHVIMTVTALLALREDNATRTLIPSSSRAYKPGSKPRRLVASVQDPDDPIFFLVYEDSLFDSFLLGDGEILPRTSGVDTASTVSTGTHLITNDYSEDVFAWAEDSTTLVFQDSLGTIRVPVGDRCDDVTALHSQPPIARDGRFSFTMKSVNDSTPAHYHVTTSFNSPSSLEEVIEIRNGTAVASSSYLSVHYEDRVTVYDRRQLENGVPATYIAGAEIRRVVAYESENHTHFLVVVPGGNLIKIKAREFIRNPVQGVEGVPNTLQGAAGEGLLPYADVGEGVLVAAKNGDRYDIVALAGDGLTEVARVGNIPEQPGFVTFIPDPIPPPAPPTVTTTTEATPVETSGPTTESTPVTTGPTESPSEPAETMNIIVVGCVVGGIGVIVLLMILAACGVLGWLILKRPCEAFQPKQEKKPGLSEMAHLDDKTLPIVVHSGPPQPPPAGSGATPDIKFFTDVPNPNLAGAAPAVVVTDVDINPAIDKESGEGPSALALDKRKDVSDTSLPISVEAMSDAGLGDSITSTPVSLSRHSMNSSASSVQSSRAATPASIDRLQLSVGGEQV